MSIKYKSGYKYQLVEDYSISTAIHPARDINTKRIFLDTRGSLCIKAGYAWDGPSGPTIDTKNFMRGSLVHDALYQLMRYELLEGRWRDKADRELQKICIADGMSRIRAWWVYQGLRIGGKGAADPSNKKEIHTAP